MAYNLQLTNGSLLTQLPDGTLDTTASSLALIGKNYPNWGIHVNQNSIRLAENFANSTAPLAPLTGQLWYDTVRRVLKVHTGNNVWKVISSALTGDGSVPPGSPSEGDIWWNPTTKQLFAWNGSANVWRLIGPLESIAMPPTNFTGNTVGTNVVGNVTVSNKLVGVFATADNGSFPATGLAGITRINPGLNFVDTVETTLISSKNMTMGVSGGHITISSINSGIGFRVVANVSSSLVTSIQVDPLSGRAGTTLVPNGNVDFTNKLYVDTQVNGVRTYVDTQLSSVSTGILANYATIAYVDNAVGNISLENLSGNALVGGSLVPKANLAYNLGSTSLWWNNIYGTAIHAKYADLAERFEADDIYTPGVVVQLGGSKEVTKVIDELSDSVFGVVSEAPAYLMNSSAGDNDTHPPIAVQGRVPVQVLGPVKKGDRLVSAGNGIARAGGVNEITPWNVIGRSLVDDNRSEIRAIEAIVKLNS